MDYKKGGAKSSATFVSGNLAFERVFDGETGAEILPIKGSSRLCSAFLADEKIGFDRPILFHGEENSSPDTFDGRGGLGFATFEDKTYTLPRIGRGEWENIVAVPFTGNKTVIFALEDGPALGSQTYMYVGEKVGRSGDALARNGLSNGKLYVFAGNNASLNSEETVKAKGQTVSGHWEPVNYLGTDKELDIESQNGRCLPVRSHRGWCSRSESCRQLLFRYDGKSEHGEPFWSSLPPPIRSGESNRSGNPDDSSRRH